MMQEIIVVLIVLAALCYLVWSWWPRVKKGDCGIDCACGAQRGKGLKALPETAHGPDGAAIIQPGVVAGTRPSLPLREKPAEAPTL
jgi:hypothetical protein